MTTWRRICCGIDFSETSRVAMREAADLARRFDAELALVHVFELPRPSMVAVDMLAVEPEDLAKRRAAQLQEEIAPWKAEAERICEKPVFTDVVPGDPASELVRFASERGFDVIVVATHGRTGLSRVVLGSVAEHVVRHAPGTVIVVRDRPVR
jgi:universal stress protein A